MTFRAVAAPNVSFFFILSYSLSLPFSLLAPFLPLFLATTNTLFRYPSCSEPLLFYPRTHHHDALPPLISLSFPLYSLAFSTHSTSHPPPPHHFRLAQISSLWAPFLTHIMHEHKQFDSRQIHSLLTNSFSVLRPPSLLPPSLTYVSVPPSLSAHLCFRSSLPPSLHFKVLFHPRQGGRRQTRPGV